MGASSGHLDALLNQSFDYRNWAYLDVSSVSVTGDFVAGTAAVSGLTATSLRYTNPYAPPPQGVAPIAIQVTAVDDASNTLSVTTDYAGFHYAWTYHVIGFGADSILLGDFPSDVLASLASLPGTDLGSYVFALSDVDLAASPGTVVSYRADGVFAAPAVPAVVDAPNQTVHLGFGGSRVTLGSVGAVVIGDAGDDYIADNGVASTIDLGSGVTTVNVLGGNPTVYGSQASGSLFFSGGRNAATVYNGAGAATVFANAGGGRFFAGDASSLLFVGGGGASTVVGGIGSSVLFGGGGNDLLVAGAGASTVVGAGDGAVVVGRGAAGDVLVAGGGAETLVGSADGGRDVLFAGIGNDALFAGTGGDTLVGAARGAQMFGGSGADVFVFSNGVGGGATTIWNFAPGQDRVALFGYGPVASILPRATVGFGAITLTLSDNTRITFANTTTLRAGDFV